LGRRARRVRQGVRLCADRRQVRHRRDARCQGGRRPDPGQRRPAGGEVTVLPGVIVFLERPPDIVRGQHLGLVTSPGSVDAELRTTLDLLTAEAGTDRTWRVTRLFGPEHGLRGDYPAGGQVPDSVDEITGLPVSSLYGQHKRPTAEMLAGVDVLVVDLTP